MRVITFNDIKNLNISASDCYTWVEIMLRNKSSAILPAKTSMSCSEGVFMNTMPSIIRKGDKRYSGVKIVTRYPERTPSLDSQLMLMDADNGQMLALMDANWITAMRTGAVAAHSIMLLGKKGFTKIGIIGLGNTARAALLVLASIQTERPMQVCLFRYKGQENLFVKRFSEFPNLQFTYCDDIKQIICDSEILISAATYFDKDICDDKYYPDGITVVPIHTRGFMNCDLVFDKIYADDTNHVRKFNNFGKFRSFAEVSDVLNNNAPARENDRERILVYNIGISLHDIYFATQIYQLLKDDDTIKKIDLLSPEEKFWI